MHRWFSRTAARIEIRGLPAVWLEGQWNLEAGGLSTRGATELPAQQLALAYHALSVPLTCCSLIHTLDSAVAWHLRQLPAGIHFDRLGVGEPAFDETLMRQTTGTMTQAGDDV